MTSDEQKRTLEKRYLTWLESVGWEPRPVTNAHVFSEYTFQHPSNIRVRVIQQQDKSDRISFVVHITLATPEWGIISGWTEEQRLMLQEEIKRGLIMVGVQFVFGQGSQLTFLSLQRTIFGESITKQIFFDNAQKVIDGAVFCLSVLQSRLGKHRAQLSQSTDVDASIKQPYG